MKKKRIIWYDDHLTTEDRVLIEEIANFLSAQGVEYVPAATQNEFAQALQQFSKTPSFVSGILLDLMLTTEHFESTWECLNAGHIKFEPYLAGRQVLEILKLRTPGAKANFVDAFQNHSTAILTAASEVIILENIPLSERAAIPVIFKDGSSGTDPRIALSAWIATLPLTG